MKMHKAVFLLGLAAILVWGTAAKDEAIRIGIVDIDQAVSSTEEGKAAREGFAQKQREAEEAINPMVEEYRKLEDEFKAKQFVLSDEARYQMQLDLMDKQNKIQNRIKELQGQLQIEQKRLEAPLTKKLVEIIGEIGKSSGFTLIMSRGAPGVLYTREALDITDMVIEKYNKKKG
jgi:outer membrane protein